MQQAHGLVGAYKAVPNLHKTIKLLHKKLINHSYYTTV